MSDAVQMLQNATDLVGSARVRGFEFGDTHDAIAAIEAVEGLRRVTTALTTQLEAALDSSQV